MVRRIRDRIIYAATAALASACIFFMLGYFLGSGRLREPGGAAATAYAPPAATVSVPPDGETEVPPQSGADEPAGVPHYDGEGRLRLNYATREEFMKLPGIGAVRADAIIARRDERGGFKAVAELLFVSGIGETTLAKFAEIVTAD